MSNWTFSPPMRRSKSRDDVRPSRWKKYSFPSSAAMKPKPRSETTFLMVPVVTMTSTLLERTTADARSVRGGSTTRSTPPMWGEASSYPACRPNERAKPVCAPPRDLGRPRVDFDGFIAGAENRGLARSGEQTGSLPRQRPEQQRGPRGDREDTGRGDRH